MGKKSDPPPPPDPRETAAAQTGTSVATAIANTLMGQVNQIGPDGSLTYTQTGTQRWQDPNSGQWYDLPQYTAETRLSEDAQQLRDANNRGNIALSNFGADQADRLGDLFSEPFDPMSISPQRADRSGMTVTDLPELQMDTRGAFRGSGMGRLGPLNQGRTEFGDVMHQDADTLSLETGYENDFSGQRQEVIDGLMGQLNEQRGKDLESLRSDLYARGVREGSEQYSRAMEDFDRSNDDRRLAAIMAGGQEQTRLVNMARDEAAFGNQAETAMYSAGEDARRYDLGRSDNIRYGDYDREESVRRYGDEMELARFDRAERARMHGDQMNLASYGLEGQRIGQNNATTMQNFSNALTQFNQQRQIFDDQDRSRAQALDEAYASRAHPINEISALLSGSQINTPNFAMATPSAMPTTDIAGLTMQAHQAEMANWQAQQQNRNAMMGGLFGLAGAGLTGGIGPSWMYGK